MSAALMEQRPQVLARAVQGDSESFARLLEPLLDPAYRLAAVMLADRGAAEDAVQEASVTRRTRWWSVIKLADVREPKPRESESYTDLHRALLKLKADERLPLVLHFYLDLPLDEVARTLRVSPSAAKSRIYRAAKRLREDLTMEEVF